MNSRNARRARATPVFLAAILIALTGASLIWTNTTETEAQYSSESANATVRFTSSPTAGPTRVEGGTRQSSSNPPSHRAYGETSKTEPTALKPAASQAGNPSKVPATTTTEKSLSTQGSPIAPQQRNVCSNGIDDIVSLPNALLVRDTANNKILAYNFTDPTDPHKPVRNESGDIAINTLDPENDNDTGFGMTTDIHRGDKSHYIYLAGIQQQTYDDDGEATGYSYDLIAYDPLTKTRLSSDEDRWSMAGVTTQRIQDAHFTADHAYIITDDQKVWVYTVDRTSDPHVINADSKREITEAYTEDYSPRRISGFGDIIFLQQGTSTNSLTLRRKVDDTYEVITSEFDTADYVSFDAKCSEYVGINPVSISTYDGEVYYISLPTGDIHYIRRTETGLTTNQLSLPENSAADVELQGHLLGSSNFSTLEWNLLENTDEVRAGIHQCFKIEHIGDLSQTAVLTTKDAPEGVDCNHDHETDPDYEMKVEIADAISDESIEKDFTIKVKDVDEPPPGPTGITLSAGATKANIGWTAPTLDGHPPTTGFDTSIARAPGDANCPAADSTSWTGAPQAATADATSHTFTGLDQGTHYCARVRTINHEGESGWVTRGPVATTNSPTLDVSTPVEYPENATTPALTFTASDDDADDTITISIKGPDAALFSNAVQDANDDSVWTISFASPPNYEDPKDQGENNSYSITVRATSGTDPFDETIAEDVVINVTNVNEPHSGELTLSNTQPEEGDTIQADTSGITDPDGNMDQWEYQWQIQNNDGSYNTIPEATSSFRVTDYLAGKKIRACATYNDTVHHARSEHICSDPSQKVVANHPPTITPPSSLTVEENHSIDTPIKFTLADANPQDSIKTATYGSDFAFGFSFNTDGELRFVDPPDFEENPPQSGNKQYEITLFVTSGVPGSTNRDRTTESSFTIEVADVDEPPTAPANLTFSEVKQKSLKVAWDESTTTGPEISKYQLQYRTASEEDWPDADTANILDSTNTWKTVSGLNSGADYQFRARAVNDEGDSPWSGVAGQATDANDPPRIDETFTHSVPENTAAGTTLINIVASDPDISDGGAWAFETSGDAAAHFELTHSGNTAQLKTKSPLNYEATPAKITFSFTVTVKDGQGASGSATVTITLTDVEEDPSEPDAPTVAAGETARSIKITWTEPDNGGPPITHYKVHWSSSRDSGYTELPDNYTGLSATVAGLKAGTTYYARITAVTDEGEATSMPGSGATADNVPPTFGDQPQHTFTIDEDAGAVAESVHTIGAITATDPDGGAVSYEISGTDHANFTVDPDTGLIASTATRFDHESKNSYTFTLTAKDSHPDEPQKEDSVTITVRIDDIAEPPLVPTSLQASAIGRFQFSLDWEAPNNTARPDIEKYVVQHTTDKDAVPIETVDKDVTNGSSAVVTGLKANTQYYVRVYAVNDEGDSPPTEWLSVTTAANRSPVFDANTNSRSFNENTAKDTNIGSPIGATDADGDTITYSITGDNPGSFGIEASTGQLKTGDADYNHEAANSYTVTVRATDSPIGATTDQEVTISVTDLEEPPSAVEKPTASNQTPTSLTFSWNQPGNTGPDIDRYTYQHRKGASGTWSTGQTNGSTTSVTITGLDQNTGYSFRVRAENPEGEGGYSPIATSTTKSNTPATGAPVITGTPHVGETLTADTPGIADADGLDNVTFTYQWQADGTGIPGATASTYTLQEAEQGKRITVTVSFTDDGGTDESRSSAQAGPVLDVPDAPTSLTADRGDGLVALSWTAPADTGGLAITRYEYEVDGDGDWKTTGGNGTSFTVTGLTNGTQYSFRVRAVNGVGDGAASNAATATPNAAPSFGAAPALSVPENTAGGTDVGSPVTATDGDAGDTLAYSLEGTDAASFDIDSATGQIATVSTATYDHEAKPSYPVTVKATDRFGASDTVDVTISVTDVDEPPLARAAPTVTPDGLRAITVSWSAPDNAGRPAITGYDVQYRKQGVSDWSDASHTGTGTSAAISGLEPDTVYEARVRAVNDEGAGDWSATGNGRTGANTPATGAPAITGMPLIGKTLTAGPGTIADANGLTNVSYSYQWLRGGSAIPGATSSTYELVDADVGQTISVTLSFTDDEGFAESLTSAATKAVEGMPVISIAAVGDVTEGADASFTLTRTGTLSLQSTLTVAYGVSESRDMVDSPDEGTGKTVQFTANAATATITVPTVDDSTDEEDSTVTATVAPGNGYTVSSSAGSASLMVMDDEDGESGRVMHDNPCGPAYEIPPGAPGPMTGLTVEGRDGWHAILRWTQPADSGDGIHGFQFRATGGTFSDTVSMWEHYWWKNRNTTPDDEPYYWYTMSDQTWDGTTGRGLTRVMEGVDHNICVRAVTSDGKPGPSTTVMLPGFGANEPTNLQAVEIGRTWVKLTWTAPTLRPETIDQYMISWPWELDGEGKIKDTGFLWGYEGGGTDTSETVTGLKPGTTYKLRVRGMCEPCESDGGRIISDSVYFTPSDAVVFTTKERETPPMAPAPGPRTGPWEPGIIVAGATRLDLVWTAPASVVATGYEIQWSTDRETGWTAVEPPHSGKKPSYSHTGLTPLTVYHYRMRYLTGDGPGEWSHPVAEATAPDTWGFTAAAVSDTRIHLWWTAPQEVTQSFVMPQKDFTGYSVEWSPDGETWQAVEPPHSGTEAGYSHTGLAPETAYYYRVAAVYGGGTGPSSPVTGATTLYPPPYAPDTPYANAASHRRINLSWSATTPAATGYEVEWSTDGSSWNAVDPAHTGVNTFYAHKGRKAETAYHYRVRGVNGRGLGEWSETASVTTPVEAPSEDTTPGREPRGLRGEATGAGIVLTWTAPQDAAGEVTGYQVQRWVIYQDDRHRVLVENTGSTATTYTDADVADGEAYSYRIRAIRSLELSGMSNPPLVIRAVALIEANTPATGAPTISGTARVGQTLAADTSGISDEDGLSNASITYQWQADGSDIAGATGSSYTLTFAEANKTISVRVSFTDDAGNEETLTSAPTGPVSATSQQQAANTPASGLPTISGTAQVGQTLAADTSGIADEDGLSNASFTYQWQADGSDIAGATGPSHTLTDANEGMVITVTVSFTDDAGNAESLTSPATEAVAGPPPEPLTASFSNEPSSHDGESVFTFELQFSEEFSVSYKRLRDHAFEVTGGDVKKAKRLIQGSDIGWRITVKPDGDGAVSIILPETTDCEATGAICTGDGRMLSNRLELTVVGPGG